jgi:hypothetical protein
LSPIIYINYVLISVIHNSTNNKKRKITMTTLTDSHIFVGNSSNVATDVAMTGDVTIDDTGNTTIAFGVKVGPGGSLYLGGGGTGAAMGSEFNTSVGENALGSITTGKYNVAVGYQALDNLDDDTQKYCDRCHSAKIHDKWWR